MTRTRSSSDTKAAILAAARTRFAAEGYRSASIRAVARDVGVDAALVVRYFGSKPGLFAAATDIDLRIPDLTDAPAGEHGERLVEHFLVALGRGHPGGPGAPASCCVPPPVTPPRQPACASSSPGSSCPRCAA